MPTLNYSYTSPAKLNLMLKVVGKRDDGYHLLETVFCLIDLCDSIELLNRTDGKIVLHNPQHGILPEHDLTVRAAYALQQFSGSLKKGVDIRIDKKIPLGGGLGGGSSNAATVLMVLNHLWHCDLDTQTLMNIGAKLGADVPFFIFGQTAFAQGIGEQLTALPIKLPYFVIIRPPIAVSTAEIFSHFSLTSVSQISKIDSLEFEIPLINDLQKVAVNRYPEIAKALSVLHNYGKDAMMTGSGSCVFLKVDDGEKAQHIASEIQILHPEYGVWAVKGLAQHPLQHIGESSSG